METCWAQSKCFSTASHRQGKVVYLMTCWMCADYKPQQEPVACSPFQLTVAVSVYGIPPCNIQN